MATGPQLYRPRLEADAPATQNLPENYEGNPSQENFGSL